MNAGRVRQAKGYPAAYLLGEARVGPVRVVGLIVVRAGPLAVATAAGAARLPALPAPQIAPAALLSAAPANAVTLLSEPYACSVIHTPQAPCHGDLHCSNDHASSGRSAPFHRPVG